MTPQRIYSGSAWSFTFFFFSRSLYPWGSKLLFAMIIYNVHVMWRPCSLISPLILLSSKLNAHLQLHKVSDARLPNPLRKYAVSIFHRWLHSSAISVLPFSHASQGRWRRSFLTTINFENCSVGQKKKSNCGTCEEGCRTPLIFHVVSNIQKHTKLSNNFLCGRKIFIQNFLSERHP